MATTNTRKMVREDTAALGMKAIDLDVHLKKRREQIENLDKERSRAMKAIDAINTLSGRASAGHDKGCECSYCIIHRIAFEAWKMS